MARKDTVTLLDGATVAADQQTKTFGSDYANGLMARLEAVNGAGTLPTLDVKLQEFDVASNDWIDVPGAAFAQATTGTSDQRLTVYPGIAETANVSVSDVVGRKLRFDLNIAGASASYTVDLEVDLLP